MTIHTNTEQRKKLKRYDIPWHAHELTFFLLSSFSLSERPHMLRTIYRRTFSSKRTFFISIVGLYRNLWNAKAVHSSVNYIEYNPVRAGLVNAPEEWLWSSAHARYTNKGLLPDNLDIPVLMK